VRGRVGFWTARQRTREFRTVSPSGKVALFSKGDSKAPLTGREGPSTIGWIGSEDGNGKGKKHIESCAKGKKEAIAKKESK